LITRGILTRQQRLFDALSPDFVAGANLGTDFSSSTGTPGTHRGDGTVEFAGVKRLRQCGFRQRRNGNETVYAHLSKINVQRGQSVSWPRPFGLAPRDGPPDPTCTLNLHHRARDR
jgi:hypothetical protein